MLIVAIAPRKQDFLNINSTVVYANLDAWMDAGCSIINFEIKYKMKTNNDWLMLSNDISPDQKVIEIRDLMPETWYSIAVVAFSESGRAEEQYSFITLDKFGGIPLAALDLNTQENSSLFLNLSYQAILYTLPSFALVVLTTIAFSVWFYLRKKYHNHASNTSAGSSSSSQGTSNYLDNENATNHYLQSSPCAATIATSNGDSGIGGCSLVNGFTMELANPGNGCSTLDGIIKDTFDYNENHNQGCQTLPYTPSKYTNNELARQKANYVPYSLVSATVDRKIKVAGNSNIIYQATNDRDNQLLSFNPPNSDYKVRPTGYIYNNNHELDFDNSLNNNNSMNMCLLAANESLLTANESSRHQEKQYSIRNDSSISNTPLSNGNHYDSGNSRQGPDLSNVVDMMDITNSSTMDGIKKIMDGIYHASQYGVMHQQQQQQQLQSQQQQQLQQNQQSAINDRIATRDQDQTETEDELVNHQYSSNQYGHDLTNSHQQRQLSSETDLCLSQKRTTNNQDHHDYALPFPPKWV